MTRISLRRLATLVSFLAVAGPAAAAEAQGYFGRNKVQYETFDWRILKSEHFDNFFYPAESVLARDAARMAERWYTRHSDTFRHAFDRKSLIFYADQPDWQQTNVVNESFDEGTGGVTEPLHTRVVLPFTGVNFNNDHVIGHELVHVFQYNIAEGNGGLQRLDVLPLWLIEGMAEYFSLGRNDPLTAMWMRDAVMRDKFPTINQLTTDPRFFPYRYGQALWAYVGGRWGDRAVVDVYRTSLRLGWDQALIRVLGESNDSLSKDWAAATRATYLPIAQTRTHPDSVAKAIVPLKRSNDYNISPSLSPDGKLVAFFSSRDLFGIDLFLADAQTGKVIKKLTSPSSDRHIDAISFVNSSGDWSPDGQHFAFIAYANGDNQIAILSTASTKIERKYTLGDIGAVSSVAWSPNGKTIAMSGQKGGISDLYLLDVASGKITQLTNDRYSDVQPTWSPDGNTIAFVTDRDGTDFDTLKWGPLRLALLDVATGTIRSVATFQRGRSINPQFAPDGRSLYFISDQDGVPDVYRYDLAAGQSFRITKVATGVSGITSDSPALSVARGNGRLAFTVFKNQGFGIFGLEPSQLIGTLETGMTLGNAASELPPVAPSSLVSRYLGDPVDGLPSGTDFAVVPYHSSFSLDAVGQPQFGASIGGPFGSGVVGGVSALWGDQLGDRQIFGAIQANGTVKDIGGAVQYYNLRKRWNWGAGAQHMPFLTGGVLFRDTLISDGAGGQVLGYNEDLILQRIYIDQASFFAQYPFSTTQRFEFSMSGTHQSYSQEIQEITAVGQTLISTQRISGRSFPSISYAEPSIALVGDNSNSAYTSPVTGERYRFSYAPVTGSFSFQTVTADYRKYLFMKPFSLAFRGLHYGRYGKDSEDSRLWPVFLGEETFVRGYGYGSITGDPNGCLSQTTAAATNCPALDRLFGSRIIVANTEFRIPLFGSPEFGLIPNSFIPMEVSPFFDAGVAYTSNQPPDFRLSRTGGAPAASCRVSTGTTNAVTAQSSFVQCADRIPVFSSGVSFRVNVLGYMIFEAYLAHPFQRPEKNWVWGFQLAPGW